MREFMLASLVVLTAGAASAETRDLSNFTSVNVSGRYRAEIAVGESYSVTLDGADAARGDAVSLDDAHVLQHAVALGVEVAALVEESQHLGRHLLPERVEVLEVDHSHARAGGWFVWARVRALP